MCSGRVRILATISHCHGTGTTAGGSGFLPRNSRTPRIAWLATSRRPLKCEAGASRRRSARIRPSRFARSSSGILASPSQARRRWGTYVASLEILRRGFENRDLARQACDCLIEARFCAFDIEGALMVHVFRHGSWHLNVDHPTTPCLAVSVILPVSGTETTGHAGWKYLDL